MENEDDSKIKELVKELDKLLFNLLTSWGYEKRNEYKTLNENKEKENTNG